MQESVPRTESIDTDVVEEDVKTFEHARLELLDSVRLWTSEKTEQAYQATLQKVALLKENTRKVKTDLQ